MLSAHLWLFLLHVLITWCCSCAQELVTPKTLVSPDSYLLYPPWIPAPQRILNFTFQTSQLNCVLLYSEDANGTDYLLVRLVGGSLVTSVSLREGEVEEEETLGEFLNDNQPHHFILYHNPVELRFHYQLDGGSPVVETYAGGLVADFGASGVFVGGMPPNITESLQAAKANFTSFVGCIQDVLFLSSNIDSVDVDSSTLQALQPIETGGVVRDGCTDPCSGVECGAGRCVGQWPDTAFCDCRGTGLLGERCDEDPTLYKLTFEPTSDPTHYCYRPLPQPYVTEFNSASLELLPPIPSEGTLLVAHPDGRHSFSLRVQDSRIVYEYQATDNVTRQLMLDSELQRSGTTYRVNLTTTFDGAEVVLFSVVDGVAMETERSSSSAAHYPPTTVFSTVCLGGSLLEYRNYVGTIRSAFYGYNSLLEERNFCRLEAEGVSRSELIVFADSMRPRSLVFERFPLSTHRIVFQARSRVGLVENQAGILLLVENLPHQLILSFVSGGLFLLLRKGSIEIDFSFSCMQFSAFDGEWHSYEILPVMDPPDGGIPTLDLRVNGIPCSSTGLLPFARETLAALADSPLQFGATNDFALIDGVPATFAGCVSGIELQRTNESEIFRPNLEAVPRVSDLFDVSSCHHCNEDRDVNTPCGNGGQVCVDRGWTGSPVAECECPEGFTGVMCLEPVQPDFGLSHLTPNLTCTPAPPPTTPPTTTTPTTTTTPNPDATTPPAVSLQPNPTSSSTAPTPTPTSGPVGGLGAGVWAGLGVGVAVLLLILAGVLVGLCVLYRRGARIRGFYNTNESATQEAPMIRFSASLRQLSSEVVSVGDSDQANEMSWSHKNGAVNGGYPSISEQKPNRTSGGREKEFYL